LMLYYTSTAGSGCSIIQALPAADALVSTLYASIF
jgi:hypothetical protein